jgi:hypothetical protein
MSLPHNMGFARTWGYFSDTLIKEMLNKVHDGWYRTHPDATSLDLAKIITSVLRIQEKWYRDSGAQK